MLYFKQNKGFTLVEVCIAIAMSCALIGLILNLTSIVRNSVAIGTVDLQNLQDARLAINYLRRDFTCATPLYEDHESYVIKDEVRADPILFALSFNKAQKSRPIIVNNKEINFCKITVDSANNFIREEIHYYFDFVNKTLNRRDSKSELHFKGIEDIDFNVYYHPLAKEVPMLFVKMKIKTTDSGKTKELDLTTTICSSIVNRDIVNLNWNSY